MKPKISSFLILFSLATPNVAFVDAAARSAGLTLLETAGARAAALGESFSSIQNDVTGMAYNPASLASLSNGHLSFLYHQGLVEDRYGQFMIGSPFGKTAVGISASHYNGGDFLYNNGVDPVRSVTAQSDLSVTLGYAVRIKRFSVGLAGKYLSSELAEEAHAQAFAGDVGLGARVSKRLHLGASLQNFGNELTYIERGDPLPRLARLGSSVQLLGGRLSTLLLMEGQYLFNEKEFQPSVGLEISLGVLALRGGFQGESETNHFSVGTGFVLGRASLDYAFGMVQDLNNQHRVSLAMRFGGSSVPHVRPVPVPRERPVQEMPHMKILEQESKKAVPDEEDRFKESIRFQEQRRKKHMLGDTYSSTPRQRANPKMIYQVRPGDTLSSIAAKTYGDRRLWKRIYTANRHLIENPQALESGQKIVLP